MFRRKILTALLAVSLTVSAAAWPGAAAAQQKDASVSIKIVHTNDIHARALYKQDVQVGYEKLKTYLDREQPDLVLDAGDTFHGQAFATLEQGGSIAALIKAVGYDAMTPGNHDWNYGKERLKELGELAGVPILASNITEEGTPFFENSGYLVKEIEGVKVGVFGVYDPDIKGETAPANVEGLDIADDAQTANKMAETLRAQGCEIVIALSHQLYCDDFIARTHGIDVLIAGHEHAVIDKDYRDADYKSVKVVETGKYFENIGRLDITYNPQNDTILSVEESIVSAADAAGLDTDPEIQALAEAITKRQAAQMNEVLGHTTKTLDGTWEELRIRETSLGRVVTAAYLMETGADVAFENAGGIRLGRNLQPGDITYRDILDIAPFGNYIVTKSISGAKLLSILERSVNTGLASKEAYDAWTATGSDQVRWPVNSGSYLQFGGLTASYDPSKPAGERIQDVLVGGQPLVLQKQYTVATNNFIAQGSDYPELADAPEIHQYATCDEALTRFVQRGQKVVDEAASTVGLSEAQAADPDRSDVSQGMNSQSAASPDVLPSGTASGPHSQAASAASPQTGEHTASAAVLFSLLAAAALGLTAAKRKR